MGPVEAGVVLGQLFFWFTAAATYVLTLRLTASRWAGLLAAAAAVVTPKLVWAGRSGMEVPLYTFLVTAALACYVRAVSGGGVWTAAWGPLIGLAGWARPETFWWRLCCWCTGAGRASRSDDRWLAPAWLPRSVSS